MVLTKPNKSNLTIISFLDCLVVSSLHDLLKLTVVVDHSLNYVIRLAFKGKHKV